MSINNATSTKLEGIKKFISDGFMAGELSPDMTIVELLNMVEILMKEKDESYFERIDKLREDGNERDTFG